MSAPLQRRELLKGLLATGLVGPLSGAMASLPPLADEKPFSVHIFSKHLHFLPYTELAATASDLGFDGVDLTVRPDGHVEPARVREDLPKAVQALQQRNLRASLMTTAVVKADDAVSRTVLETASQQGIRYYRTGWLPYPANQSMPNALKQCRQQLGELAKLNQRLNLAGAYQNHAGTNFGSAVWDLATVLEEINSPGLGCQYDIRHATVEGGTSWPTGLRMIHPHIRFIAVKDVIWEKVDGKWKAVSVPLGQGMVDFPAYFALLKQLNVRVPISLHLEYPLGGADQGKRDITIPREKVYQAMQTDLQTLRAMLKKAGLVS
ncbi:sugar phosphate isomerase/epimerase [Larkinella arboricola]|uniref:Sugar phosphate isomerase/epimerase n=1 Tax=Larkinella arboricola TaxID=643671 RepID=A0A327WRS9_LARAB|nr:sugar phosphate isomerase/epimerase family protein [Larkinella arboricola]RAJ94373.1 sugar phosphate isomerase/epimerase [Larkinella arboricola]